MKAADVAMPEAKNYGRTPKFWSVNAPKSVLLLGTELPFVTIPVIKVAWIPT
jgi:hypothetical protein